MLNIAAALAFPRKHQIGTRQGAGGGKGLEVFGVIKIGGGAALPEQEPGLTQLLLAAKKEMRAQARDARAGADQYLRAFLVVGQARWLRVGIGAQAQRDRAAGQSALCQPAGAQTETAVILHS